MLISSAISIRNHSSASFPSKYSSRIWKSEYMSTTPPHQMELMAPIPFVQNPLEKKNISFSHRCVPDIIPCNKLLGSAQCPFQIFWRLCHLVDDTDLPSYIGRPPYPRHWDYPWFRLGKVPISPHAPMHNCPLFSRLKVFFPRPGSLPAHTKTLPE